jgi:glycosyltransferase involved in cell wall biosynthesis
MNVRIIVATLGQRGTLKNTLKSISNQNIVGLEVKIVVPVSKIQEIDALAKVVDLKNYEIIQDENKGLSAAINQGFDAKGDFDFFCWINDDDELTEGSLHRSLKLIQSDLNVLAVVGNLGYVLNKKGKVITNRVSKLNLFLTKIGPNIIPQPGSLIKRTAINNQTLLNKNYKYAMDLDLWLRILKVGEIGIVNETQALMNWHDDSITVSNRRKASTEAFSIRYKNSGNLFIKLLVVLFYFPTRFLSSLLSKIN